MKPDSIAARQEVWHDETLYPCTTAAHIAFEATGANMRLFAGYTDLVSSDPDQSSGSNWMTYVNWLEGEIGITTDRDPHEYEAAEEMSAHYKYVSELWEELAKIKPPAYNHMGVTQDEHERYCRQMLEGDQKWFEDNGHRPIRDFNWIELVTATARRQRINVVRRLEPREEANARHAENLPDARVESILNLPGELYVRYDATTQTFLGFGFTPINDAHPGFTHLDGPVPDCDLTEWDNPVWRGMRESLENTYRISGEWAFAVQWTEDGWRVK